MSDLVRLVSGYRVSGQAQYLAYDKDRLEAQWAKGLVNKSAYLDSDGWRGFARTWKLSNFHNADRSVEFYTLQAAETARDGMPDNPDPETYWAYTPWFLCLIDNEVLLSPVGNLKPFDPIDEVVAHWTMTMLPDGAGNLFARFKPVTYPGAALSANLDGYGNVDRSQPVGIRDGVPTQATGAMDFYFEAATVSEPAPA